MKSLHSLSDDELAPVLRAAAAMPDVPAACVDRALALWRAPLASPPPRLRQLAAEAVRRIEAVLGFDSWAQGPLALGVRSAGAVPRHMLFHAGPVDVDLRLSPLGEGYAVSGQVLGTSEAAQMEWWPLSQAEEASPARRFASDELGGFHLEDVEPGRYELRIAIGADHIVLAPIELGGEAD